MNARFVEVRAVLDAYLPIATDAELEALLRAVARECARRDVQDTGRLFDVARAMERARCFGRRAEKSE